MAPPLTRSGGILLHPTSLPGPYGIGDLGPHAHAFIEWLADSGCGLWQVLPLGPTSFGNSPYQCHSVFAGNVYLVSPELLISEGLLAQTDLEPYTIATPGPGEQPARIDFSRLIPWKLSLLNNAFTRFRHKASQSRRAELSRFCSENADWLDDFSLFMALKERYAGAAWIEWPTPLRLRQKGALEQARQEESDACLRHSFCQMLFFRQWKQLRRRAHECGLRIIGDVPIFAATDSSEVWAHPELFRLDKSGKPNVVAGVPPDYFSPTGQLWGNPLYRWENHKASAYRWWLARLRAVLQLVDTVRLDHFRGFAGFWAIPAGASTAETGEWRSGPAESLLDAVVQSFAQDSTGEQAPLVAEDLGVVTPDVVRLLRRYDLPAMRILQFGLSGMDEDFLPHRYVENCFAYTGTHDNDTSRGWFAQASEAEKKSALRYLKSTEADVVSAMVRSVWSSVAGCAIIPMQDLLELGPEARMNYPGRAQGNWEWRLQIGDLSESLGERLKELNLECGRARNGSKIVT